MKVAVCTVCSNGMQLRSNSVLAMTQKATENHLFGCDSAIQIARFELVVNVFRNWLPDDNAKCWWTKSSYADLVCKISFL